MPQEPKKRHSRQRQGKRRASIRLAVPGMTTCLNCGHKNIPHTVCSNCGYYKGQDVMAKATATPKEEPKTETPTA
jgi:large subunit ribosomal protein L32